MLPKPVTAPVLVTGPKGTARSTCVPPSPLAV
jgi:hypothetical protein